MKPGSAAQRIAWAQDRLEQLIQARAGCFEGQPDLPERFEAFERSATGRTYLIHEYLNSVAEPMYHADVAADFLPAKLDYVGQGTASVSFQSFPPVQQQLLDEIGDPAWRETVKDFIVNTRFRMDVFVRGRRTLSASQRLEGLRWCWLHLIVPRREASLGIEGLPRFERDDPQDAVLDALARAPMSFDALSRFPLFGGDVEVVAQVAALMSGLKQASVSGSDRRLVDAGPAHRLNRVLGSWARHEAGVSARASPVTGQGVRAGRLECLVWDEAARCTDSAVDPQAVGEAVWSCLSASGDQACDKAAVAAKVSEVLRTHLPLWRRLQML